MFWHFLEFAIFGDKIHSNIFPKYLSVPTSKLDFLKYVIKNVNLDDEENKHFLYWFYAVPEQPDFHHIYHSKYKMSKVINIF